MSQALLIIFFFTLISLSVFYKNSIKRLTLLNIASSILIFLFLRYPNENSNLIAPFISDLNLNLITDPTPQALTLTAIVVGAVNSIIGLSIAMKIKKSSGSLDF